MDRDTGTRSSSSFVYVSDSKLATATAQTDVRRVRGALPKLQNFGINLGPFNATFGMPTPGRADRDHAKAAALVAAAEQHIRASSPVGDLAVGEQWISGRVDMGWAPLPNGQTVLFCGYAGPLLVVLGGSLSHMYGPSSSANGIGSYSYTIKKAVLDGHSPEDLGRDLAALAREICDQPEAVRFVARVIERGELPEGFDQREFLLATPLYVRHSRHLNESGSVVRGTLRWLSPERGWGLIAPDAGEDDVVVTTSALAGADGSIIRPGQRVTFRITQGAAGIEAASVALAPSLSEHQDAQPAPIRHGTPLGPADPIRIGSYEVLRRLGEGSMGVVYLGRASARDLVAIKVIRPDYARNPEFVSRFRGEYEHARRIIAPNVARVLASAVDGDRPYLVTEFIDGLTLEDHVERHGPLPLPEAMRVAAGVAAGLAAIHAAGIAHRDLAPSNIIVSTSGPKIIDFGIARPIENYQGHTHVGMPVGTLRYASPEQIEQSRITEASDIFSWGGVTVFAATGHLPFGSADIPLVQVLDAIRHDVPNLDRLPSQLHQPVVAALDKDPARRPTAQQIAATLTERAASGTKGKAAGGGSAGWKALPRGRMLAVGTLAGAVIVIAVIAVPLFSPPTPSQSTSHPPTSSQSTSHPPTSSQSTSHPFTSSPPTSDPPTSNSSIDSILPARPVPFGGAEPTGISFNHDGTAAAVALGESDYGFLLLNPENWKAEGSPLGSSYEATGLEFDPADSNLIAVAAYQQGQVLIWNLATANPEVIQDPARSSPYAVAYVSGTEVAEGDGAGCIYLLNPAIGGQVGNHFCDPGHGLIEEIVANSSGIIAAKDSDGNVYIWNSADGERIKTISGADANSDSALAFSPDGKTLAIAMDRGGAQLWNVYSNDSAGTLPEPGSSLAPAGTQGTEAVAFCPDGAYVTTGDTDGYIYLWGLATHKMAIPPTRSSITTYGGLAFGPDGKTLIAYPDENPGNFEIYNVTYRS